MSRHIGGEGIVVVWPGNWMNLLLGPMRGICCYGSQLNVELAHWLSKPKIYGLERALYRPHVSISSTLKTVKCTANKENSVTSPSPRSNRESNLDSIIGEPLSVGMGHTRRLSQWPLVWTSIRLPYEGCTLIYCDVSVD